MRKNTKGFTLIELLAVIVILAIIALITTPIILNVIENSRLGAAKDKAYGVIEAVKLAYTQAQATEDINPPATVDYSATTQKVGAQEVTISGDKPESGTVTIDANGIITVKLLKFGKYYCSSIDSTSTKKVNANNMVCSSTASDVTPTA